MNRSKVAVLSMISFYESEKARVLEVQVLGKTQVRPLMTLTPSFAKCIILVPTSATRISKAI